MNKYFISDLDKTLIYTSPSDVCVEFKDKRPISYMTRNGFDLLKEVLNKCIFIPCTMRSFSQTMRIIFIKEYKPKFIICQNGASIYIDNKIDLKWDKYMKQFINIHELELMKKRIELLNMPLNRIKIIEGMSIEMKFDNPSLCIGFIKLIKTQLLDGYRIIGARGSRKISIFNNRINKKYAVEYLKNKYNFENIFVAGDSLADKEFTRIKDSYSFLPGQALFTNNNGYKSKYSYIESVEDILSKLIKKIR